MATNAWRELGEGTAQHTTTKNVASAKTSGTLIPFPLTQAAGNPVALLTKDAGTSEDNVPCIIGGIIVTYACVTTDTGDPGVVLYYDAGNDRLTTTASTHNRAGRLAVTKGSGPGTAQLILNAV